MKINLTEVNGDSKIIIEGELSLNNCMLIEDKIKELVGKYKVDIHLDVGKVKFTGKSGMAYLIAILKDEKYKEHLIISF